MMNTILFSFTNLAMLLTALLMAGSANAVVCDYYAAHDGSRSLDQA